jgi:hypothetical protein
MIDGDGCVDFDRGHKRLRLVVNTRQMEIADAFAEFCERFDHETTVHGEQRHTVSVRVANPDPLLRLLYEDCTLAALAKKERALS